MSFKKIKKKIPCAIIKSSYLKQIENLYNTNPIKIKPNKPNSENILMNKELASDEFISCNFNVLIYFGGVMFLE